MKRKIIIPIIILLIILISIGMIYYMSEMSETDETQITVDISTSATEVSVNEPVHFSGNVSGGTPPYTYFWNFGSLETSNLRNTTYTFLSPGVYTCKLIVTDDNSNSGENTVLVSVVDDQESELTVQIAAYPTTTVVGNSVDFTSSVSGGTSPYTYEWSFGATSANPTHTFQTTGTKSCYVTVTDSDLTVATSNTVVITVEAEPVSEPPGLGFRPPVNNINEGDEFWVIVYLDPPQATGGWKMDVSFSESYLEVLDVREGDDDWSFFDEGSIGSGIINDIQAWTTESNLDHKTDICKIKFRALNQGVTTLSIPEVKITGPDAVEYTVQINEKTINIE